MKILILGDFHFGEHGDSKKYNKRLLEFIEHVCDCHAGKIDKVVQLGDFFHHRSKLQIGTMNRGIEGAEKLSSAFGAENVFVLIGNHDIPNKDNFDDSSLAAINHLVNVVDKPISMGDCFLVPWIITDHDWEVAVSGASTHEYLLAHLELNGFLMGENHVMASGQNMKELRDYTKVFSGHYHSFQEKGNVIYTGIPMPVSYSEANKNTGYWILDTASGEYEMIVYDKVKVISVKYDDLEDTLSLVDDPLNTSIRVEFDDLSDESIISDVAETLMEMNFSDVKVKYTGSTAKRLVEMSVDEVQEVENIDANVTEFIKNSSTVAGVERARLERLYIKAKEREVCDQS